MFTGIITDIGEVTAVKTLSEGKRFRIKTSYDPSTIDIGASIACDGVCLTVTRLPDSNERWFEVEAWEEALRLTTADSWATGKKLNLERALKAGDEYGGHMVSGHVDSTAKLLSITDEGDARRFLIEAPMAISKYIAPKGSIALNGTSLTVNAVDGQCFDVLLIRHSLSVTTWATLAEGEKINIEIDQIARYVERYVNRLAETAKGA